MKVYHIVISISLFLSLILGGGLVLPGYQRLKNFQEKIKEKKVEIEMEKKYFADLQKTSEELKKYQVSLSKIDSALPKNPSLPEILDFIQKASSKSGLTLKGISPASISKEEIPTIRSTSLSLSLEGSYEAFKDLISILENSARIIEVENISFSSPKEGSFTFNIRIKFYSY